MISTLAGIIKQEKFQEKTTIILNDVAEVVLSWNLGKIEDDEAMKKINNAFAKHEFFN